MRRLVYCEGPDDIAALRELLVRFFGASVEPTVTALPPAGRQRKQCLRIGAQLLELHAVPEAKSGLWCAAAKLLGGLPRVKMTDDPDGIGRIWVVYDPDGQGADAFCRAIAPAFEKHASQWKLTPGGRADWVAERDPGERVSLAAIAWRAPDGVVDGLADTQSLDRLVCAVAARAFPEESRVVHRWLDELTASGKRPGWKAALHLWCAVVEQKANEDTAAVRFLGQNRLCEAHARGALEEVSLLKDLASLAAPPERND
jgi:hypothetical protein